MVVDDSGNVYVTGICEGFFEGVFGSDYLTIKYYPNGDTAWVRTYDGPGEDLDWALDIAVDDSGNVYVTGESLGSGTSVDYATIKYYPNGDTAWVRRYNGPANGGDGAKGIALDGSGNVYVTGNSRGIGTDRDYATIKYYPNGDTAWVRRYNGPANSGDQAFAMTMDDSGSVYVTGKSGGSGTYGDYATIKYYPYGDTAWVTRYNGPANGDDGAYAIAVDDSGYVYVTGTSVGIGTDDDYLTIKYMLYVAANFSADPGSGFVPLTVDFTDLSLGNVVTWFWDFGDDSTSTEQNPVHTYHQTGVYDVKLIISDGEHYDTITKPQYIGVFDTLTVDFSGDPTQGHETLSVSFQHLCNNTPSDITWYFGDGDSSSEFNPNHEYAEAGSYDVKLVAEIFGYKDSLTKDDYIRVSDIEADFAADSRCGSTPLEVSFTDSSTSTFPITDWHWDFGDGETSDLQEPTHEFQDNGHFDITLIVSDGIAADTLIKEDYIIVQDLSADFFGVPTSGRPPLTVMFEPTVTGMANQYFWDFGDGETSTLPNPIHIYANQGKYDVKFKAALELEDCSQVDSVLKEEYVVVLDLDARFSADPMAGIAPLQVQFSDESTGEPTSWFWWFGDGGYSYEQNPVHEYQAYGHRSVFLRVTNALGQVDSLLKLSYIFVDEAGYVNMRFMLGCSWAKPGFDMSWFPTCWNYGTKAARDCVIKTLLPPQIQFVELTPYLWCSGFYSGYSWDGDTIVVPVGTIEPCSGWDEATWLGFLCYVPTNVPAGEMLTGKTWFSTSTTPFYGKTYSEMTREVWASSDPNDKLADPEGKGTIHAIEPDQPLTYTIQFENKPEATAEAIYIVVVDTLDQNLDWSTFAMLISSHPDECDWEFDPYTGVITWFCDSIMLPPNENPPEGEGYFIFSISPDTGLSPGTEIANSAWIRFDYNEWLQAPEEGPVIRTIKYESVGDVTGDGIIDLADILYLISYLYKGGPAPDPIEAGDANYDGLVDLGDVLYLISYLYKGGPPPRR